MMPLELSARNTPATLRSTGTTIAAAAFKDYVVFGADSRATAGSFIASSNCLKLHRVTDEI
ncbi:MAG: Proteasome subunit beta type-7 [Marteilia pararefringens]